MTTRRKNKEERRKKTKEERKNRVASGLLQKNIGKQKKGKVPMEDKQAWADLQREKIETAHDKEQLFVADDAKNAEEKEKLLESLNIAQKLALAKEIADEIINASERRYRKLADLIALTRDRKDIDVVLKALELLCKVFLEIIPDYKLREEVGTKTVDDKGGAKRGIKLSKDVKQLREFENFLLSSYKDYLMILERLTKIKPHQLISKTKIIDEAKRERLLTAYSKMRVLSVQCFCDLLEKHPHFNYRLNIL